VRVRAVLVIVGFLGTSGGAAASDALGLYHDCLKDFEALKKGHIIDGGKNEIRQNVNYSKSNGLGNLSGGLTSFVDRDGDGKSIYFLSDTHAFRVRTDFTPQKSPKFLSVKSPVTGKSVFVRASGTRFGGKPTYGVNSGSTPLDENNLSAGPKSPPLADLEQLGETEATSILDRQVVSLLSDMPKMYESWLSELKAMVTISPTDNHGNNDYGNYFRGSDQENIRFQKLLRTEYGAMLKTDYLPKLLPKCAKLTSPTVKLALSGALTGGESIRTNYAGPSGKPGGNQPASGTKKSTGVH
jgi:hypothetical protein